MTYRERATKLIGSYWDSAFTRTGNNKAEMKRAIKRALIDINHTMDEMEELRKLTKSDEFILLINGMQHSVFFINLPILKCGLGGEALSN